MARQGKYKLLYVAPERLESDQFAELLDGLPLSLVAIDECPLCFPGGARFPNQLFKNQILD